MKKLLYIFIFITSAAIAQPQFNLIAEINVDANFFTTDNQSNVYIVKGNELSKYSKTGKLLYQYSNINLGNIDFVDASNMLRLLLFYKNFSQVVLLDNTLSLTGEPISLDNIGFQQTQLACSAYDNGIWLYNQQNLELLRLDQSLEKAQQTGNLSQLLNINLLPNYLEEYDNKVYLNNPLTGILVFDIYGTYFKTIPIKGIQHFQVVGDWMYFIADGKAKAYNIQTTDEIKFEMPLTKFKNFRLELGVLIIQADKSISIYNEF